MFQTCKAAKFNGIESFLHTLSRLRTGCLTKYNDMFKGDKIQASFSNDGQNLWGHYVNIFSLLEISGTSK